MQHNQFEIRVLVKGRPITEYYHNGQMFVEGRDGSNFEIEFKNLTAGRVEAVLAVDGLSVIDGKDAGPASPGYVVEANGTLRIPGWKLTDEQVAQFVFAGKKNSYASQSTGSARNAGVLGAMVFAEKPRPYQMAQTFVGQPNMIASGYAFNNASARGIAMPFAGGGVSTSLGISGQPIYQMQCSTSCASPNVERKTKGGSIRAAVAEVPAVEQTLGTAFGAATEFETQTVTFNRCDLVAMLVILYDDSRGLRSRGLELTRPSKQRITKANAPQAFPAMNCEPPKGWKG